MMLSRRSLISAMKALHLIFILSIVLSLVIYLVPQNRNGKIALRDIIRNWNIRLPNYKVHVFYEAGFRNKKIDGKYNYWPYNILQGEVRLATNYYPLLGYYSSNDPFVVDTHMRQIETAGIGVVVVSWWPPEDRRSPPMALILHYAQKHNLKVTIQIQNYKNRNIENLRNNLKIFFRTYSHHPAFYKTEITTKKQPLPLLYIYKSYLIPYNSWRLLLGGDDMTTVRGTEIDALYIGQIVKANDRYLLSNSYFDGFYTFFAYSEYTYGATWYNWPYIQDFAYERNLIFIPTVIPGYDSNDLTPSPSVKRNEGSYYTTAWIRAIISKSKYISINSFNGWLQGTQIEPVQSKTFVEQNKTYSSEFYAPDGFDLYLTITNLWIKDFTNRSLYRTL